MPSSCEYPVYGSDPQADSGWADAGGRGGHRTALAPGSSPYQLSGSLLVCLSGGCSAGALRPLRDLSELDV